jgi:hypothetical protein
VPAYTRHEIDWIIPVARGRAEIHAARILDGTPMVWPRLKDSALGRWWLRFRNLMDKRKEMK